jgi:Tfp pilus assembly protein PilX
MCLIHKKSNGFVLPMVIFILVILGLLSYAIFSMNIFLNKGTSINIMEHKAYAAAKAGLGVGLYDVEINGSCASSGKTIVLDGNSSGFKATYSCQSVTQNEVGNSIVFYQVTSIGCNTLNSVCPDPSGTPTSDDYAQRMVTQIIQK